jgi:hypothetical protein
MTLTDLEWNIANTLTNATKSTFLERIVDSLGSKGLLSGYDRHSLGAIVATPKQIQKYGFDSYAKYPGSNMFSEPISLYHSNITNVLRDLRSKEGITLIELGDEPQIVENGLILPFSNTERSIDKILHKYESESTIELAKKLGLSEEMGGKTLALLELSAKYPDVLFVRVDGSKYALKGTDIYHMDSSKNKDERMNIEPIEYPQPYSVFPFHPF